MAEDLPQSQQTLAGEFRRLLPSLILTVLIAFGTSWYNSQLTQNDLRLRLDRLEERQKETAAATAAAALASQQAAIRLAELGIIQTTIAEQVRDLKLEHERQIRR